MLIIILGRLLQVEYAINNINNAGLCLGITTSGGRNNLFYAFLLTIQPSRCHTRF